MQESEQVGAEGALGPAPNGPTEPPPLPPTRVGLYGAGNLGAGLFFAFVNGALPLYLASYGLPNWAIGFLAQDRPPLAGLSQLAVGALSDRTRTGLGRRRPYIALGVPIAAAALFALGQRPPSGLMIGLLLAVTTFLAVAYGPYLALLADLVPATQRGRVGSVQALANMLGQFASLYLAAQFWADQPRLVFWLVSGGLLFFFGLTLVGLPERSLPSERPRPLRFQPRAYLSELLSHREVLKYLASVLLFYLGTGGVVPFLTRFAVNELGTDESTAFQLLMVAILATAAATLPAGWLGDRLGKKPVLLFGLVLFGLAVLVGSQVRTVEQAALALVVTGVANAICTALLFPLLADLIPPTRAGEFMGIGSGVWELGQPLGALLAGLAADASGSLRAALLVAGLLTLVSAALLAPVRAPRSESAEPSPAGG